MKSSVDGCLLVSRGGRGAVRGKWRGGEETGEKGEGEEGEEGKGDVLMGSLAKHGIEALVPSRSLTFTMIISWEVTAGAAFALGFLSRSFLAGLVDSVSTASGVGCARGREEGGGSRSR